MMLWQTYRTQSGKFVMRWCLNVWWTRWEGRLTAIGVGKRRLWTTKAER